MRAVIVSALAVLLCLLSAVALVDARGPRAAELTAQYTFDRYVQDFKKPYVRGSAEYDRRAALFKESLAGVLAHNADPKRTYSKGVNHMSDWSAAEFKAIRGARHSPDYKSANEKPFVKSGKVGAVPESVDWRGASPAVLTAVKDQGMCGDCWAHAVTEAVESAYARATGNLYALSQQQVTSCTPRVNSCFGCDGFYPKYAYDFVAGVDGKENATQGLVEEWVYSFSSWRGDSGVCNTTKTQMGKAGGLVTTVQITGFTQVPTNDEEAVMEAVATLGPLSILVDAMGWQQYESGVFTGCAAYDENFALDHAVMLVGYGHDAATSLDYWIVRNSWSAAWGENGYVRIAKSGKPACGDTWTLSCANQSYTTKACGPCGLLTDAQFPNVVEPTRRRL